MSGDAKPTGVPFRGSGQEPTPSANPEAGNEAPKGDFVTRADLEQFGSDLVTSLDPILESKAQSFADKTGQRLEKRVKEIQSTLEGAFRASGKQIPEGLDLRQMALTQAIEEGAASPSGSPSGAIPPVPAGLEATPGAEPTDPSAWAQELEEKTGIRIESTDPEFANIKDDGSIAEYITSYYDAIKAKQSRTASPPPNGRSPATIPTGGGNNNPIAEITDPAELLRIHREKREAGQ